MTKESKILTVSYGTFSCTLEGFDDPFITMKAIAEYFRDLTAEDRYFGAEPPQPDAAMLHRIAEREVTRLVDTRSRDGSAILNSVKEGASGRVTGRARTPREPAADVLAGTMAPVVVPALQDVIPDGVAAKLSRIRKSVNLDAGAAQLSEDVLRSLAPEGLAADEISAPSEDLADLAALDASPGAATVDKIADLPSGDAINRLGALIADPEAEQASGVLDAAPEVSVEGLADQLSDALPEDLEAAGDDPVNLWMSDGGIDATPDDALSDLAEEPDFESQDDQDVALSEAIADNLDDSPVPEDDLAAAVLADVAALADAEALADTLPEDLSAVSETVDAARLADPLPEDQDITPEFEPEYEPEAATETAADPVEEPVAEQPAGKSAGKSRRVSSRVVRIHPDAEDATGRSDSGATRVLRPTGEDAEVARLLRQADEVMAESENRSRIEALAHLKAAVQTTEAERTVTGGAAKPTSEPSSDVYREDLAKIVEPLPAATGPDFRPRRKTVSVRPQEPRPGTIRPGMISPMPLVLVSEQRIDWIAPTDTPALSPAAFAPEPEVATRLTAEMATLSELRPEPGPAPVQTGPMVPGIGGTPLVALRTGRLTGAIGVGSTAASPMQTQQNVLLDRIVNSPVSDPEDGDDLDEDLSEADEAGLANFAERVGVKSMADMLEAAAAYATCIEKRDRFTRPQLMRRLMASAGGKPVSREDGLRSFGTLLRTGRIEKISRGHYVLAEHSPYLTEARRLS